MDFVDKCNTDTICIHKISIMSKELGHSRPMLFYYLEPKSNLHHGLRELVRDSDKLVMCKWVCKYKVIDVYIIIDP